MWHRLPEQQQQGAQIAKGDARAAPAADSVKEAHADGEKGKPTARDATGQKQQGYSDENGGDGEDKPRKRNAERPS